MLVVVAREGDLTGDELVQLRTGAILSDGQQLFLSLCLDGRIYMRVHGEGQACTQPASVMFLSHHQSVVHLQR